MCCVCDVIVTDRWYPLKHQVSSCAPKPILFPHTWPSARALMRGVLNTAMFPLKHQVVIGKSLVSGPHREARREQRGPAGIRIARGSSPAAWVGVMV